MTTGHGSREFVIGLDVGGTKTNATVLDDRGNFLIDHMVEVPSLVRQGPPAAIQAMAQAMDAALAQTGVDRALVRGVGLDTPGPASATGTISSRGGTNFAEASWWGYDIRSALEAALELPVVYNNDGNAAALYAHNKHFGLQAAECSSISAIVGTGLGGGVIIGGHVVCGMAGMAGELGHVHIPMHGLLDQGQPTPQCNCGFFGDAESVASLTAIQNHLLPYWLTQYPNHPLHGVAVAVAAKEVRGYGERGDEMALRIFAQQAMALGRLFTIAANFTDPDAYFVGGGVIEAEAHFRDWFIELVRSSTTLRDEQREAEIALVSDLDMAGARGSAVAALNAFIGV